MASLVPLLSAAFSLRPRILRRTNTRDTAPGPSLEGGKFEFDEFFFSCSVSRSIVARAVAN